MESESLLRIMAPTLPLLRKGTASAQRRSDSTRKPTLRASFHKNIFSEVLHSDPSVALATPVWLLRHLSLCGQNFVYCAWCIYIRHFSSTLAKQNPWPFIPALLRESFINVFAVVISIWSELSCSNQRQTEDSTLRCLPSLSCLRYKFPKIWICVSLLMFNRKPILFLLGHLRRDRAMCVISVVLIVLVLVVWVPFQSTLYFVQAGFRGVLLSSRVSVFVRVNLTFVLDDGDRQAALPLTWTSVHLIMVSGSVYNCWRGKCGAGWNTGNTSFDSCIAAFNQYEKDWLGFLVALWYSWLFLS